MAQKTLDFARFKLAAPYTPGGATPDNTVTIIAVSSIYDLELQRQGGNLTKFRLTLTEKTDTTQQIRIGLEDVASTSVVGGKNQYVVNIRKSSSLNLMVGLANDDNGTNNDANIIAENLEDLTVTTFSKDSSAKLAVGTGEFAELQTLVENAVEEIKDESNLIAAGQNANIRANDARQSERQDTFETDITQQQNDFETDITTQQDEFEVEQQQNFDNFVADQFRITGQPKTGDNTILSISSGDWLDGQTERPYAGAEVTPAINKTLFYELDSGTGNLSSNEVGFTAGSFPICKVVTDGVGISTVTNYGAAYQVPATLSAIDGNSLTVQVRRDTAANFTSGDPTLAAGEHGYETDTGKFKIGDGATAWTSIAYFSTGGAQKLVEAHTSAIINPATTTNTYAKVIFNTEDLDVSGEYNNATGVFTAGSSGLFNINFNVIFDSTISGTDTSFELRKNGTAVTGCTIGINNFNDPRTMFLQSQIELVATDTLELYVKSTAGVPSAQFKILGAVSDKALQSRFIITKLS